MCQQYHNRMVCHCSILGSNPQGTSDLEHQEYTSFLNLSKQEDVWFVTS